VRVAVFQPFVRVLASGRRSEDAIASGCVLTAERWSRVTSEKVASILSVVCSSCWFVE
jgi:hypothetical protein